MRNSFLKPLAIAGSLLLLSGCIEDETEITAEDVDNFAPTAANYSIKPGTIQCPTSCTTSNGGANVQTAALCDGARSAYASYAANANSYNNGVRCERGVCIDVSDLETLYRQFQETNQLAGETFNQLGC